MMLALTSDIKTPLHAIRPSIKLAAMSIAVGIVFALSSVPHLAIAVAITALIYLSMGLKFAREGLRMLRPLRSFLVLVLVIQTLIGDPMSGVIVCLRLSAAVAIANLVTLTTRLEAMIDLVMRLAAPLRFVGLSPRALALAMAMVLRFVPVFLSRANTMQDAFRARSIRRPTFYIVMPLIISVLEDADQIALALRARGGLDGGYEP
mgnify:CR=1 FL=1